MQEQDTTETENKRRKHWVATLRIQIVILVLLVPPTALIAPVCFHFLLLGFIQKDGGHYSFADALEMFRLLFLQGTSSSSALFTGYTILALLLQTFYWQAACFLWRRERRKYFYFIAAASVNTFFASSFKALIIGADIATHMLFLLTIPAGALIAVIHLFLLKCYHRRWPLE